MTSIPPRPDIPRAVPGSHITGPPKSKAPLYLGLAAAAGLGYYFYSAGNDPTAVRRKAESMLSRNSEMATH